MSIDLPTPIGLKLLNGLLGSNGHGNGPGHGVGNGPDGGDADNRADQARQNALQNERNAEASNDQGRWGQSEGANGYDGVKHGHGHHHDGGDAPRGPGNNNGVGNGSLPNPGDVLSNALGKADGAVQNLLGQGQDGSGVLGKLGDLTSNLLNPAGHLPPGQLAKALDAVPLANTAGAAANLLNQAAQALNAPGAQALAARNALHDAATTPLAQPRDVPAALHTANSNLTNAVPATARAADAALIQNRQDVLPLRADQAALGRTATSLPAGSPPPAAPPIMAEPARVLPFAAPPATVPPTQSPPMVEGRPNPMGGGGGGDGSVGAPQKTDMAQQTPPGHTGAAPTRGFRNDEEEGDSLAKKMIEALAVWLGLAPEQKAAQAEGDDLLPAPASDDRWLRLQWLFWALAVAGYGCLAIAVIVFIPGGAGFLDEARNPIVRPALVVGLGCSIAAWWLARKIAKSR